MTDEDPFVDYYTVLQVDPACSAKVLEAAYRQLAKNYHPDHPETADAIRFNAVIEAYRALRKPEGRLAYDVRYAENIVGAVPGSAPDEQGETDEKYAISDAEAHTRILLSLYRRRRENAHDAGVMTYHVQQMLNCSNETLDFHVWYLKAKGLIATTEQGTIAITIDGVDHVISMSRTAMAEKLLISQSSSARE